MTPNPNFTGAGRKVLAAAVLVGMSAPLSVSTAMASPEHPAGVAEQGLEQEQGRELSTIERSTPHIEDAQEQQQTLERQPVQADEQSEEPSHDHPVVDSTPEVTTEEGAIEETYGTSSPVQVEAPLEELAEQALIASNEDASVAMAQPSNSEEPVEEDVLSNVTSDNTDLAPEENAENESVSESRAAQPAVQAIESDDEDPEDDLDGEGSEDDLDGEGSEDDLDGEESDDEEESESEIKVSSKGPEISVEDMGSETDYLIRIGEVERTYTTDRNGSSIVHLVRDFELEPGIHQVTLIGPNGRSQEQTFYATQMQADNTRINILGLDPSATYKLEVNRFITQVGSLDFTAQPDGTYTANIYDHFPQVGPGLHRVTLTGAGYTQVVYVRTPWAPNPEPEPDPVPNPDPDPGVGPVPNPDPGVGPVPNPDPGVGPVPNPMPAPEEPVATRPDSNPDTGTVQTSGLQPSQSQAETTEAPSNDGNNEERSPGIEVLDTLRAAEAIESDRRPSYDAGELPMASGDQGRHAAPENLNASSNRAHGIEAAPMPHSPVPLEQESNEAVQSPRNTPVEADNPTSSPDEDRNEAQSPTHIDTERSSTSTWGLAALFGSVAVLLAALALVLFGRNRKTD